MLRHKSAVHNGFPDPWIPTQHLSDFSCRHVLALPAVRVAQPVEEEPPAVVVAPQRVARAVVQVPLLEHVALELLLRGRRVVVVSRKGFFAWYTD